MMERAINVDYLTLPIFDLCKMEHSSAMAALRIAHMEGTATDDPTRGELRTRMITKSILVMPSGELRLVPVGDNSFNHTMDPQLVFSSPDDAASRISNDLATVFPVNPDSAGDIARRIVAFALVMIRVGGDVRFGLSMSTVLEKIHGVIFLSEMMGRFESIFYSFGSVPESWGGEEESYISEDGDAISTGPGLSETEVSRLKTERFNKEVCSVCLDEYNEGDVITPLGPFCPHKFHHKCIVKWLSKNRTCPVCRTRVAV